MTTGLINPTEQKIQKPRKRKSRAKPGVPYASATSGASARDEVTKILRRFGCEAVGFMDHSQATGIARIHPSRATNSITRWKAGRRCISKANPTYRMRTSRHDYEQAALRQGLVAVNSILRDWINGQMTAVECGILSFEAVFMPYMLPHDGRPLHERAAELLPAAENEKIVSLPRSA